MKERKKIKEHELTDDDKPDYDEWWDFCPLCKKPIHNMEDRIYYDGYCEGCSTGDFEQYNKIKI